jgi:hypothetical protein
MVHVEPEASRPHSSAIPPTPAAGAPDSTCRAQPAPTTSTPAAERAADPTAVTPATERAAPSDPAAERAAPSDPAAERAAPSDPAAEPSPKIVFTSPPGSGSAAPQAEPPPAPASATPSGPAAAGEQGGVGVAVAVEGEQSDVQAQATAAKAPTRLRRGEGRSPRDMALSLLVLLVPIALLLVFYRVVLSGDAPVTIDAAPTIQEAQAAAFPVAVPDGLNDNWHVTSATFKKAPEGATLRLGYVAPDDDAALLIESNVPAAQLLPVELSKQAKPRGTFRDGEAAWRRYLSRPGETALVLTDQSRTIIILGNTDEKNLQALAAAVS